MKNIEILRIEHGHSNEHCSDFQVSETVLFIYICHNHNEIYLYVILNYYLLYSSRFYFVKTFSFENTSHIFSIIDEREVICVNRKENFKLNTHYILGVSISMNSFLCFIFRVYSFLYMKSFQPVASHSTFFLSCLSCGFCSSTVSYPY